MQAVSPPSSAPHEPSSDDPELRSAAVRIKQSSVALSIWLLIWAWAGLDVIQDMLALGALHLTISLLWPFVIRRQYGSRNVRLSFCIGLDTSIIAGGLALIGPYSALCIWMPLIPTIANMLRYGAHWVRKSLFVTAPIYLAALLYSSWWRDNPMLLTGFMANLVIVPLFAMWLSERLAEDRSAAQQRVADLERHARADALTGALNRAGIEHELAACLQGEVAGALIYIDLDGFKAINDAAGHAIGDRMLQAVAAALRGSLRSTDRVGRLGGDEFAAVLPGLRADEAHRVADKLLAAIQAISLEPDTPLRVSASMGVCLFPVPGAATGSGAAEALALADQRMYAAKRGGKSRIVLESEFGA
jgi:diguanylate cyclase (GGDEF)-like protein